MLKVNASYSKKVPVAGQEFSSQSYHASVEVELPDGLSREQLAGRIHDTFVLVRDSVENELRNGNGANQAPTALALAAPQGAPPQNNRTGAKASGKQLQFLTDLAIRRNMDINTLNAEARRLFGVTDTGQLTRQQASQFIDMLNGSGDGAREAA
ncbi:MAG: hypothetical protein HN742_26855 [Lentisphaerae bacterium]|jgi:hypothetical protein|nr:hypothetical protein [Lentisphaerota bacterium]MBT4818751.1 hypothetical protein [Lentisphaerota bacterium]MBT5611395.1 hypothetical protein [Lentisphaerota bacterium]MBT7057050.1 hypothetical protein [Lentisphaerota bacterium]MBT7845522.1 hypothetical protein [Lentisphaerota bacterium]